MALFLQVRNLQISVYVFVDRHTQNRQNVNRRRTEGSTGESRRVGGELVEEWKRWAAEWRNEDTGCAGEVQQGGGDMAEADGRHAQLRGAGSTGEGASVTT